MSVWLCMRSIDLHTQQRATVRRRRRSKLNATVGQDNDTSLSVFIVRPSPLQCSFRCLLSSSSSSHDCAGLTSAGHADNAVLEEFHRPSSSLACQPPETANRELHQSWRALCVSAWQSSIQADLRLSLLHRRVTNSAH